MTKSPQKLVLTTLRFSARRCSRLACSLLTFAFAISAHAATTGSITLSGSVAASTAIVVAGVGNYNNLPLATTQTDLQVANVTEINNTGLGYKVTAASANSGKLTNGSLGNLTYTAKYNSTAFNLSSTPVNVTSVGSQNAVVNVTKPLTISYTGVPAANMMAGTYSDTLTFTITAN